jgi:type IX secretion system PorP/SprF family membrane protein
MSAVAQLNVHMSQYMFNGMTLNPAHTGSHEALNIQALARMQWWGVAGAPNTQLVSVDDALGDGMSGLGLVLMRDAIGTLTNMGAYINYSLRLRLNDLNDRLCFGLSAGFLQNAYSPYDANAKNSLGYAIYDPNDEILAYKKPIYMPDFKAGIAYEMRDIFYIGAAASNMGTFLVKTKDTMPYMRTLISTISAGANIELGANFALRPTMLYMQPLAWRNAAAIKMLAGTIEAGIAAVIAERVWLGASYRMPISAKSSSNAVVLSAEVWALPTIRIGYSYDMPLGEMSGMSSGSHEVSIGFTPLRKVTKHKSARDF